MDLRASRALVDADIPDEVAFSVTLADAYRGCAIADADMRATAAALEAVREARGQNPEPFPTWRELDDQIGRATDPVLLDALLAVRRQYEVALLDAHARWLASADTKAWIERVGCALGAWRFRLCQLLAAHPPANPGAPEDASAIAALPEQFMRMMQDDWDLTMPTLEWLAEHPVVAADDRAQMLARTAQIDLYFGENVAGARSRVERGATLASSARARAEVECVRGQCLNKEQKVPEAVEQLERSVATDGRFVESCAYRGDIALEANDLSSAESWYRRAISAHPGTDVGYNRLVRLLARSELIASRGGEIAALVERAAAVILLNAAEDFSVAADVMREGQDLAGALHFAERAVAADPERGRARYARGLVHAARGDWLQVLEDFRFALQHEPTKYAKARWYPLGVDDAREVLLAELTRTNDDPIVRDALLYFVEQSNGKPDQRQSALAVLDALTTYGGPTGAKSRASLANTRGNVHYYCGDYIAAREAFAEAWTLDPTTVLHGTSLVAANRQARRWDEAEKVLAEVFAVSGDAAWRGVELATIANERANDLLKERRFSEASELYARAAILKPEEPVYLANQVLALEQLIPSATDTAFLDVAVSAMERACALRPDNPKYRAHLGSLGDMRRGARRYGLRVLQRASSVPLIRVHIASNLTPMVSPDGQAAIGKELSASIVGLRGWIAEDFGIDLPPINFVEDFSFPAGAYAFELFGVPAHAATIQTDRRVLTGAAALARASAAGVMGETTTSPLNGEAALWIHEQDWPRVADLNLPLWSVMEYALYDLAYQVLRRLKEFVGHTEVVALLEKHRPPSSDLFLGNPAPLTLLVRVLQGLVAERVPIIALGDIAALVAASPAEGAAALTGHARMLPAVWAVLPGRTTDGARSLLPLDSEQEILSAIRADGGDPILAMDPGKVQHLLERIREIVAGVPGLSALVVRDAGARPHLRRIVELEFPQLWILAQMELDPAQQPTSAGTEGASAIATIT